MAIVNSILDISLRPILFIFYKQGFLLYEDAPYLTNVYNCWYMLLSLLNFLEKVLTDMNSEYGLRRESDVVRKYTTESPTNSLLAFEKAVGNNNRLITLLTWKGLGTARTKRSSHIFHWNLPFSLSLSSKKKQTLNYTYRSMILNSWEGKRNKKMGRSPPWSSSWDGQGKGPNGETNIPRGVILPLEDCIDFPASPKDLSCVCYCGPTKVMTFP